MDNNNSKHLLENDIILENLHEFSEKFIESWSSRKPVMDQEEDAVFMKVDGKSDPSQYTQF